MQGSDVMSWVASLLGLIAFLRGVLPAQYMQFLDGYFSTFSLYTEVVISNVENTKQNELYKHVHRYLSSVTFNGARKSHAFLGKNTKKFTYHPARDESIVDIFCGVRMEWKNTIEKDGQNNGNMYKVSNEKRYYTLRLSRMQKHSLLEKYLQHIVQSGKSIQRSNRELRLYSNRNTYGDIMWNHIPFAHPASFDTIAIEPELKRSILEDLDDFTQSGEFYRRIGRPWKRGYLLYGPPGTGKTTVVAAMANKLHYDIYDLELTAVTSNTDLKTLLIETTPKSIIVIEDIDCSLDLTDTRSNADKEEDSVDDDMLGSARGEGFLPHRARQDRASSKMTLSGLLNFTDGLWSSTESERIFVFTTNYPEKLDPALLRSGRMDMHIHLSFCTFAAFKMLASSFLKIDDDVERYSQLERLFGEVNIPPSEVAELLMRNRRNVASALETLLDVLREMKANLCPDPALNHDGENDGGHAGKKKKKTRRRITKAKLGSRV